MRFVKVPSGDHVNLDAALSVADNPETAAQQGRRRAVAVLRSKAEGGHVYYDEDADAIMAVVESPDLQGDRPFWVEIRRAMMIALKAINVKYGFRDS